MSEHEDALNTKEMRRHYYRYIHSEGKGEHEPHWRGVRLIKFPSDLCLYHQVIWKRKPDFIIETGTAYGGSALFYADMMRLTGCKGRVITIDVDAKGKPEHPLVEYVKGSSVDPEILSYVKDQVKGASVMVVLDSDHSTRHVAAELEAYKDIVTKDQYLVVEDCWTYREGPFAPYKAVQDFLKANGDKFKRYNIEKQFVFAVTRDGWLRKIA